MNIRATYAPPPIPDRNFDWSAIDVDTYDGAEDSRTRHQIGYGRTEQAAIDDLIRNQLEPPDPLEAIDQYGDRRERTLWDGLMPRPW